jgi:putative membrane protein
MSTISIGLIVLVAVEFFYIMYLETFATTSSTTSRIFNMSTDELNRNSVKTLFKNQGIYFSTATLEISRLLLVYIILVAFYGSLTSDKKIIVTQGGLAILALISTFVMG